MPEISNRKRKFIKRNFKHLSIEELAHKTGLKPNVIISLIDEYSAEMPGEDQPAQIKSRALSFLSWKTILLTSLLFAAVAIIIYYPGLHGDFVFDDEHTIRDNPLIHITRVSQLTDLMLSKEIGRRIGLMSFALNYYFGELNIFGYHLVNVIIHILNGLILFLLSYTILSLDEGKGRGDTFKIAFLGSFIWLVHPLQTQAVSYIVQRLTSLSALFFLLSLLCYIKGRVYHAHKRLALYMFSMLFGLLALGTKQNTATLPLFIILSEVFFFQRQHFKIDRKRLGLIILFLGLFILISGIYLGSDFISRIALQYEHRGWTPLERVLTQLRVVVFYISLLIYPHPFRLNVDHNFPISSSLFSPFTTFLSLLFIIGWLALAIFLMKRNRLVSYALLWFLGNLVIESSIIPLELVFEHRLYLPSMALIMLFFGLCFSLPKREWEKWVTTFTILFILLFSYWTYERASVWRGPLSLWMDAAKKSPNKARPHNNLGLVYHEKGRLDEAIAEFKKAIAINPNYAKAYSSLGAVYGSKGRLDEAISEFKKALTIKPNLADAHYNLGIVFRKKGMLDEAISEYKKALAINPNYAEAHTNLGSAYFSQGRLDEAIYEYKKALAINPNYAEAHYNLGFTYKEKGMLDEAISEYKKALTINPNYADAYSNLGVAYFSKGRLDEAIYEYKKALAINPNYAEAHSNLGSAYGSQGRLDEAIYECKKALAINPNYAEAHYNLEVAYYKKGNYKLAIIHYDKAIELGYSVNPKILQLLKPYR